MLEDATGRRRSLYRLNVTLSHQLCIIEHFKFKTTFPTLDSKIDVFKS